MCGRRAGKSHIAAMVAVAYATRPYPQLAAGEPPTVALLARDLRQAKVLRSYVEALCHGPSLSSLVVSINTSTVQLATGARVEVLPAIGATVRGRTLAAAVCDEIAFWSISTHFRLIFFPVISTRALTPAPTVGDVIRANVLRCQFSGVEAAPGFSSRRIAVAETGRLTDAQDSAEDNTEDHDQAGHGVRFSTPATKTESAKQAQVWTRTVQRAKVKLRAERDWEKRKIAEEPDADGAARGRDLSAIREGRLARRADPDPEGPGL